mmetsp:Transcript_29931/g.97920  ORF Transcript_29931/g.97920 Transcript_29931/m.97920 type:complete len:204 (+) Transcript_29931:959-1570(+)
MIVSKRATVTRRGSRKTRCRSPSTAAAEAVAPVTRTTTTPTLVGTRTTANAMSRSTATTEPTQRIVSRRRVLPANLLRVLPANLRSARSPPGRRHAKRLSNCAWMRKRKANATEATSSMMGTTAPATGMANDASSLTETRKSASGVVPDPLPGLRGARLRARRSALHPGLFPLRQAELVEQRVPARIFSSQDPLSTTLMERTS